MISFDPGSMLSGIAAAQAQAAATALGYANLQFQKEQARKQYGLATAGRTDAFGNKQSFDEILKEWIIKLTPMQSQITRAGEREQLLTLTEDAQRNRDVRRRQAARGDEAADDYTRELAGYRYDQPPDEGTIFGELVGLLSAANERRRATATEGLGRQALRIGKGSSIDDIVKSSMDELGASLPDSILQAREKALSESQGRRVAHEGRYIPALQHFAGMQDAVIQAPQRFSNLPNELRSEQSDMINQIAQALANGASGVGSAYGQLANIVGNSPRFGGLTFTFGGDGGGGGGSSLTGQPNFAPRGQQFVGFDFDERAPRGRGEF